MKLVLAVVLSLCVSYAAAVADGGCDPLQRFKVKHQWMEALGTGHRRLEFAVKIFKKLFIDHPETVETFAKVNSNDIYSPTFEAFAERVVGGFNVFIGLLDDPEALNAHLAYVKAKHKVQNIKPEIYTYLGQELVSVLPDTLGLRLDYNAWSECMKLYGEGLKG